MEKRFYKYGLRPIIEEIEPEYSTFYAYQWDTGKFKENMSYFTKIRDDRSGDGEELTEQEFNAYVAELRKKL
ncbi:hypothetical protein AAEO56_17555 [Flavobacterium sp. DGU11]|uniref:Uncharacterized protein n=1 Tax=Flavobacterium arundinis TaxID=3139143 RepID=A0ABU9I219_9FLAO